MARYSNSKLNTFDTCPYKYKLQYIDKIKPDIPTTIEAFMGDMVHQTLELLYRRLIDEGYTMGKEELVLFYDKHWMQHIPEDVLVVKDHLSVDHYRNIGRDFIRKYYDKNHPFNQLEILGIETKDMMTLPDGNEWYVRIDMLAKDREGNYYVIDHKTNARMKQQWEADNDKQLAMYSLWVRKNHHDVKDVKLVWNMLAFNDRVMSVPTKEQLQQLQEEILIKIARIENAQEFKPQVGNLCHYCGYQNICEAFQQAKTEGKL